MEQAIPWLIPPHWRIKLESSLSVLGWVSSPLTLCVCARALSCVQLLVTPWTTARQAPLSMGFSRQEYWNELQFPFPGDLSYPGINRVSCISCIGRKVLFPLSHQGRPTLQHKIFNSSSVGLTTNSVLLAAECRNR